MKASLVLLCGLASVSLGKNLETLDVSVTESEAGGRSGGASTRFFWCQLYQGNCVAGCSGWPQYFFYRLLSDIDKLTPASPT